MSGFFYILVFMIAVLVFGVIAAELIGLGIRFLCRHSTRVRCFFDNLWFE